MKYQFMAEHCGDYPVTVMCHVLEVSVSGYYAWHKREPSQHSREDAALAVNTFHLGTQDLLAIPDSW